jgi:hypothetical protein
MPSLTSLTWREAEEFFGISRATLCYARRVVRTGSPALKAAMESGLISVWGAFWLTANADAFTQNWVVAERSRPVIRRRLRMARNGEAPTSKAEADAIPPADAVPSIRSVAVAAARAAGRVTGRPKSKSDSKVARLIREGLTAWRGQI